MSRVPPPWRGTKGTGARLLFDALAMAAAAGGLYIWVALRFRCGWDSPCWPAAAWLAIGSTSLHRCIAFVSVARAP